MNIYTYIYTYTHDAACMYTAVAFRILTPTHVCCSVLQRNAVCYSALQCAAECCTQNSHTHTRT